MDSVMGWLGGAFFLAGVAVFLSQLWIRGSVVEVSREGIRDRRFSPDLVCWDAIEKVRSVTIRWNEFVILDLQPGAKSKFARSALRRFFDAGNAMLGWNGVWLTMTGTTGVREDVLAAIDRFAPARLVRPPGERPPPPPPEPPNPNDAGHCLRHPPDDAEVTEYQGRRVVVLNNGRVAAEMLAGDGRWFASFDDFRRFIT
jgi:hypothetical protein